jgi:hypothetical protein
MCSFLSVIVRRISKDPGFEILHNWATDSHEDLVTLYKLRDVKAGAFARVEFRPQLDTDLADPVKYTLRIDEPSAPDWFDEPMQQRITAILRDRIRGIIVHGDVDLLCGGTWILAADARVGACKNSIIRVMLGSSQVGTMLDSSRVGTMRESSQVGTMRESSTAPRDPRKAKKE